MTKHIVRTTTDFKHRFAHYSEVALRQPVVVTKNGRPRNVLISVDEFERLKKRDRQTFHASDTPKQFLAGIEVLTLGKS
jgi:prevent-host-death family protein